MNPHVQSFRFALFALLSFVTLTARSQIIQWQEGFENGFPANMTRIDNDGLTYQGSVYYPMGWEAVNRLQPFIYFSGQGNIAPSTSKVQWDDLGDSIAISTSWYDPAGTASDWIITPQVQVPNDGWFCFDVLGMNDYFIVFWSMDTYEVRLSTTGNSIANFTVNLGSGTCDPWWETKCFDLSAYAGQNVYLAVVNNTVDNRYVWVDNLTVMDLHQYDISAKPYFPTTWSAVGRPTHPRVLLTNYSSTTLTDLVVKWSVGGTTYSQNLTGLSLAPHAMMDTTLSAWWVPAAPGNYPVKIWATDLNGNPDQNHANDTASVAVEVYEAAVERKTLIETSTGADCGPCAYLDLAMTPMYDGWGTNSFYGDVAALEYQTYYNDPSDNDEATYRTYFYNIQGYPDEIINGSVEYIARYCVDDRYRRLFRYEDTWMSNQPAFMEIDVQLSINGNTATVTATVNPLTDFPSTNLRLFLAIAEQEYTYTGGATFQTEFSHVFRKMLPDEFGIAIGPLTAGSPVTHTQSYTFTIGNVTFGSYNLWVGMNNIEVVAFVQDIATEEIFQSATKAATDAPVAVAQPQVSTPLTLYPNPATDAVHVEWNHPAPGDWTLQLMDASGRVVWSQEWTGLAAGKQHMTLTVDQLQAGIYFVQARGSASSTQWVGKLVVQ